MFTKEELEKDSHFIAIFSRMLTNDPYKVGRLVDTHTLSTVIEKICKANFEEVKYLPKKDLQIIRTTDLGFGYSSYISPSRLHELIELGKVPKDIPIEFRYQHGNVFTYINSKDIDMSLLLTDDIYFVYHKPTNRIWISVIGKPTNPNFLYYKSDLSGFKTTLDKARTVQNFNRIDICEDIDVDFI